MLELNLWILNVVLCYTVQYGMWKGVCDVVDFLGKELHLRDKVVYYNTNYDVNQYFSKPLHKGTIVAYKSYDSYNMLYVRTEGGYIDTVDAKYAVKADW